MKRSDNLNVRITPEHKMKLIIVAELLGISQADFVEMCINEHFKPAHEIKNTEDMTEEELYLEVEQRR